MARFAKDCRHFKASEENECLKCGQSWYDYLQEPHDFCGDEIGEIKPVDLIKRMLLKNEVSKQELIDQVFGTRARLSEVLNGKRSLSLAMIRKLHKKYNCAASILIRK